MSEKRDLIVSAIGIALGEASMCWHEIPKGVFDSSRCIDIRDDLVDTLQKHLGMGMSRYVDIMDENVELKKHIKEMEIKFVGERSIYEHSCNVKINNLEADLKLAVEGLRYYANKDHYEEWQSLSGKRRPGVLVENGKKARLVLEAFDKDKV